MPFILKSEKRIIRVGIDGGDFEPFGKVNSGIKRIVDSFIKEICKLKNVNFIFNYYYFGEKEIEDRVKHLKFIKLPPRLFASFFLPFYFRKDKNDVFLGFSGYLPSLLNSSNIKKAVFLYDLGFLKFPQFYDDSSKLVDNTLRVIKNADKIVVLSQYAKKELRDNFNGIDEKKIIWIFPGIDHLKPVSINRSIDTKLTKYFLYVGVVKPIKNVQALFRYFYNFLAQSTDKDYKLIVIGYKEERYYKSLLKDQHYLKLKEKIIFKDNFSDQELIRYYLQSVALLNFSHEEGFCFPVLEALSLGKKAIVNNLSVYYEFEDEFANLLVGKNEREIVQLMIGEAEKTNREAGNKRRKEGVIFKWRNFTEKLLEVIQQS